MNVLHFINNLNREGAQIMVSNLVSANDKSRINYSVCARQPGGPLAADLREQGIEVLAPPKYYGFRSIRQSIFFLKRLCIDNRISIIHAHMADAACLGWLVARKLKLPLVISHHGHDILLKCNPVCRCVYFVLLSLAARYAAMNVAVSPSVAERVRKLLPVKAQSIQIISNGVHIPDDSQLNKKIIRKDRDYSSLTLVSVGRLVPLKGQYQLIYAVARLVSYFPGIHLYIVGDGDRAQALKQQAENQQVSRYIEFTGPVEDVTEYLAKADIYVSSSRSEGMPISILEAMAWRLPVVASDIPGNSSVVNQGETGFLYELDNIDDLVQKIIEVATNAGLANGLASRARLMVAQHYSAKVSEKKHAQLYQRILGQSAAGLHNGK